MSYIYVVRPPYRFQVEIIEVEKVKTDFLRLKIVTANLRRIWDEVTAASTIPGPSSTQSPQSSIQLQTISRG